MASSKKDVAKVVVASFAPAAVLLLLRPKLATNFQEHHWLIVP